LPTWETAYFGREREGARARASGSRRCPNAWHAHNDQAGRIAVGLETLDMAADPARGLGLPPGRTAHLWVGDTGSRMGEATRASVFEPFFTTKPVGSGHRP
jgi:signal transduction histidine kinase